MAPAIDEVMKEMKTTNRDLGSFAVSIYLLGYAFGPLLIGPCSELYGRLVVYHTCTALFAVMNIGCAMANSMSMLIAFRFLTGTVGACAFTVGPSTIGDCFKQEERGKAMAVMNLPVLFGPCMGPAVGAYLSRAAGWRWDFWLITIMVGIYSSVSRLMHADYEIGRRRFWNQLVDIERDIPPCCSQMESQEVTKTGWPS